MDERKSLKHMALRPPFVLSPSKDERPALKSGPGPFDQLRVNGIGLACRSEA